MTEWQGFLVLSFLAIIAANTSDDKFLALLCAAMSTLFGICALLAYVL